MKKDESTTTAWNDFGGRLREWRMAARLSQGDLCSRVGAESPRLTQTKLSHIESGDVGPPGRAMCRRIERALQLPEDHVWARAAEARTGAEEREYWKSLAVEPPPGLLSDDEWDIVRSVVRLDRGLAERIAEQRAQLAALGPDAPAVARYMGEPQSVTVGLAHLLLSLRADPKEAEGALRGPMADAFADALSHFADLGPYSQKCVLEVFNAAVRAAMANVLERQWADRQAELARAPRG